MLGYVAVKCIVATIHLENVVMYEDALSEMPIVITRSSYCISTYFKNPCKIRGAPARSNPPPCCYAAGKCSVMSMHFNYIFSSFNMVPA